MTLDIKTMLANAITAHDGQRDRSKQVKIGPSAVGGCRRRVYHTLKQTQTTNDTQGYALPAIMGTYIHAGIAEAIKREDPFGDNFMIELEVAHEDLKGHVDLYIKDQGLVVDWKTTKNKSLRYFPSDQQKMQVQIYGYLLAQNGYEVKQVALCAIPRDGEMHDIKTHIEDYNPEVALQGIAWLNQIKDMVKNGEVPPAPTERSYFCTRYCTYYDPTGEVGCPSTNR
jgi:hypothetical protein